MIRFCDKEIFAIDIKQLNDRKIENFFDEHPHAVIGVVQDKKYIEIIHKCMDTIVFENMWTGCIKIGGVKENFWDECKRILYVNKHKLVTVINEADEIVGFAYDDNTDKILVEFIKSLHCYPYVNQLFHKMYPNIEQMYIWGCNEVSYYIVKALYKTDILYTLLEEEWEWLGFITMEHFHDKIRSHSVYLMAEGIGYHCENKNSDRCLYPPVTTLPSLGMFSAAMYSVEISMAKDYLERNFISCISIIIPSIYSVKKYATDIERQSSECNPVQPYSYISECISGKYYGNKYHEKLLWEAYGKENLCALIAEKSDCGNRDKIFVENPFIKMTKTKTGMRRIYVIGRCIVYGMGCLTKDQLTYQLQKNISELDDNCEVVSVGISVEQIKDINNIITTLPLKKGDLVCLLDEDILDALYDMNSVDNNPILKIYKKRPRPTYFFAAPIHSTPQGNKVLADYIFTNYFSTFLKENKSSYRYIQKGEIASGETYEKIQRYINEIQVKLPLVSKIGAIVMNANPFTYGHRYLAEEAANMVDWLYVFVVEEDKSEISFDIRYEFVKYGLSDIKNVIVVPSGKMIISVKTMSVYFEKDLYQNETIDVSYDIEIFARYIAPALNISIRFVGEEPIDYVTRQYNEQMKAIFPQFNIKLVEMPRKINSKGEIISASELRKALKEGRYEDAKAYVNEWEFNRLIKLYDNLSCAEHQDN